ncbi:MAG TPA: DUF222 domain-containing protein [Euzebya sp.]|nr:DUF222 domain-containing protein [Euzebya sp.]
MAAHTARIEALGGEIARLASDLFAGESRFLGLIAEFDELGGWADGHTRSCAHWLNWKLGIAMPAARERVRVARRLRELQLVAEAFADGRISYSKVRAVTRVATPATEETMLGFALFATASQLECICRKWRQVQAQSAPDAADAQRQQRDLSVRLDDDGSLLLNGRLPADVGAIVMQALAAAMELQFRADGPSEEEAGRRRADALGAIAESFLASGPTGSTGADHWQLVVHADADRLAAAADGQPHQPTWDYDDGCQTALPLPDLDLHPLGDPPLGRIQDGPCIPDPVLRRLACDTTLVGMASDADGQPIGVGRRTRTVPGWLRRLLYKRDPGCMYPGCPNTLWTDAHHIWHWLDGGPTTLDLLIRLCRGHHTHVHAAAIGIARSITDRSWTFHHPDGTQITPAPALPGVSDDPLPSGDGTNPWEGDPARLDLIMDARVHADTAHTGHDTPPDVPAETSAGGARPSSPQATNLTAHPPRAPASAP